MKHLESSGKFHNMIGDTITAFERSGCHLYNSAAFIERRADADFQMFRTWRHLIDVHSNILVFWKGAGKQVSATFASEDPYRAVESV